MDNSNHRFRAATASHVVAFVPGFLPGSQGITGLSDEPLTGKSVLPTADGSRDLKSL